MKKIYTLVSVFLVVVIAALYSNGVIGNSNAGYYVVPPAYTSTAGGSGFLGPLANAQRTYQLLLRDSILTGLVGQNLTGLSVRLLPSAGAPWPAAEVNFTNYDIYIAPGVPPDQRSFTFDNNLTGPKKLVRSGPLTINAGTFPNGGNPNNFGSDLTFDSAYLYTGGHLVIELRHTGFTGTSTSVDAAGTSTPGYGFLYSACWTGNYAGTVGVQGNAVITRINTEVVVSIGNENTTPADYTLSQNYPNPFNPATSISFTMRKAGKVSLKVYDLAGNEVQSLIEGVNYNSGLHTYNFNASKLASGSYFYALFVDNNKIDTKKMMLIK